MEQLFELLLGVLARLSVVLLGEATAAHLLRSAVVHSLSVGVSPLSRRYERACARLVDEVVVEQLHRRQLSHERIARHGEPSLARLLQVEADAQRSVVYAHQFALREHAASQRVYHLLVVNLEERPLADLLYRAYQRGRDVYLLVLRYLGQRGVVVRESFLHAYNQLHGDNHHYQHERQLQPNARRHLFEHSHYAASYLSSFGISCFSRFWLFVSILLPFKELSNVLRCQPIGVRRCPCSLQNLS